ncbi:MAG: hypothetical protein J6Y65_02245, partial [Eggerthellaceae bacterium]|nr:hypothetical protein [Eggerthellaceae bacterium]
MISIEDIEANARPRAYQNGMLLAKEQGSVSSKRCFLGSSGKQMSIHAHVKEPSALSSAGYMASVTVDDFADQILDWKCNCPDSIKYDSMCMHTVALSAAYIDDPQSFVGYEQSRLPKTSACIADFLKKAAPDQSEE